MPTTTASLFLWLRHLSIFRPSWSGVETRILVMEAAALIACIRTFAMSKDACEREAEADGCKAFPRLSIPAMEKALMEEIQPQPNLPVKPTSAPASVPTPAPIPAPAPQIRMASLPQTGPPPSAAKSAAPVDTPGVIITEETEESRAAEAAREKQGFFQRLFNRNK